jgi:hypothetical protein
VSVGVEEMNKELAKTYWSVPNLDAILTTLHSADLQKVSDSNKKQLTLLSYFVAVQKAVAKGLTPLVEFLFDTVHALAEKFDVNLPVSYAVLKLQEINFLAASNNLTKAVTLVRELASDSSASGKLKPVVAQLKKQLETALTKPPAVPTVASSNLTVCAGSALPSNGLGSQQGQAVSFISKQPIVGKVIALGQTEFSASAAEYNMLRQCTPLFVNGSRL